MRKSVLILGARGLLGQALTKEFSNADYEVTAWDKSELDITDKTKILEKIGALRPEIIINAAAYNDVDKAETEDSGVAFKINAEAVGNLAEASAQIGALFVHYSTDYVFKGDKIDGYTEDDAPKPISVYGQSKALGEQKLFSIFCHPEERSDEGSGTSAHISRTREILRSAQNDNRGVYWYLIRTSRLFGPAGTGENVKKSFVDTMLKLGREKETLDLIDEEVGSPTYAVDLARATRDLIESGAPSGIYHRTNAGACTWYEWAKKIFELSGLGVKLNAVPASHFPRPAARPKFSKLLTTKLPPLRSWEDALAEYLTAR
ncbi:MAG: sugar nucleotide-binding protein [Patescibacteria group bacterium]